MFAEEMYFATDDSDEDIISLSTLYVDLVMALCRSLVQMWLSLCPVLHGRHLSEVSALDFLFHNDCAFIAAHLSHHLLSGRRCTAPPVSPCWISFHCSSRCSSDRRCPALPTSSIVEANMWRHSSPEVVMLELLSLVFSLVVFYDGSFVDVGTFCLLTHYCVSILIVVEDSCAVSS